MIEEYHLQSPATRWYTQAQAVELYRKAGFRQVDVLLGFSLEPVMKEDTVFTVVGIK